MNPYFRNATLKATKATDLYEIETIQNLWSGYGSIIRLGLVGSSRQSVVVKHVRLPIQDQHPRGWNTDRSHQRKIKSYRVETEWYRTYAAQCDHHCRIPECLAVDRLNDEVWIILEDLNTAGYPERKTNLNIESINACLTWLANFHATFLGTAPKELWPIGTYWHLDTRPDEWNDLDDIELKKAAKAIDQRLQDSPYQTLVHGDAKLANFCFSADGEKVAAVDFQYVGGGCGMKDVAYFIGSCLDEKQCDQLEDQLLSYYFQALRTALIKKDNKVDLNALEQSWRDLYPVAWTDFHRFLKGWSPGHWKINSYSERLARTVISEINN